MSQLFQYKKAGLEFEDREKKKTVNGFAPEIPGNYLVLVQQNKVIAISKVRSGE